MTARNDIENRIEQEKRRISELRVQVERAESFLEGLKEALKLIPKDDGRKSRRRTSKGKTGFRSGSDVQKAHELLRQTGNAMHISAILVGIGEQNTKSNRMNLGSALNRYVRKDKVFARPKPNVFALKENVAASKATEPKEPLVLLPKEFGTEEVKGQPE